MPTLEQHPPRAIALTHIHLDHAGAAGTLARRFPERRCGCTSAARAHLADPARLLDSATRLYGEQMQRLWGEVLPVPAERLRVLHGGEQLGPFSVAYTPGHASHHVSYLHEQSGRAFTGDVAGVRIGAGRVLAPTPPPDIDLQAWRASLDTARRLGAAQPRRDALRRLRGRGRAAGRAARAPRRGRGVGRAARRGGFAAKVRERVQGPTSAGTPGSYAQALPPEQSYHGLRRWLSKREDL